MRKNNEKWEPMLQYGNFYEVSNLGNVKSVDRTITRVDGVKTRLSGKVLTHNICRKGYHRVKICHNTKPKYCTIHRLVALQFIGNPNNYPQVNHMDGDKNNNNVDNLEWCTNEYNMKHAIENGLIRFDSRKVKVSQYTLEGEYMNTFDSITIACKETNSIHSGISMCSRGFYKHSNGYKWVIEND